MQLKINEKVLSIPPHISTSWSQVSALRMKGTMLSVTLNDGETINIGGLTTEQINEVFSFHAAYLEKQTMPAMPVQSAGPFGMPGVPFGDATTLSFAFGTMDGISTGMHHNPEQALAPDLPNEVLDRISEIVKVIGAFDEFNLPKPEAHCNCFHCQIAKKLNAGVVIAEHQLVEEPVSDEELRFDDWKIEQAGDQLYKVTRQLDEHETYNVFLGDPVGCTCGKQGCEHILAVLKS